MGLQMMMKIDCVEGDSSSYKHKGWAEILSWNWPMTSNRKSTQGNGEDKATLNELSVIKAIGKDSSGIRLLYANCQAIPVINFSIFPVAAKREAQKSYVDITMENVVIKSIVTGGVSDDDFFKEHITLLFEKIRFEYNRSMAVNEDGTPVASEIDNFGWDIPSNVRWDH